MVGETAKKVAWGIQQLLRSTHSGTAIAVAAILDNQLERCLKQAMRPMPKNMYAELFDPMRALGGFSSKIRMAYALKIITKDVYNDLETVRKIRNTFAHATDILHFDDESIAPLLDRLKKRVVLTKSAPLQQFMECVQPISDALDAYLKRSSGDAG